MDIARVAIVGMGALGLLYGDMLQGTTGLSVGFVADEKRRAAYAAQPVSVNGVEKCFELWPTEAASPADLVIFGVKAPALERAMADAEAYVGPDTVLLSLLNGITSERILSERFGAERVVYCIAQGMDAVRFDRRLTYTRRGELFIGMPEGVDPAPLEALKALFERAGVPYVADPDIMHRMWCKFMLNVGVNQVVMVYEGDYGTIQRLGEARDMMIAAMWEVVALSRLEGVPIRDEELWHYVDLLDPLSPRGMPSMRQDGLAHRQSEVEIFSGTVCRLAEKHGLDVPVNKKLYATIRDMEAKYGD